MPISIQLGDIWEVRFVCSLGSQVSINRRYYECINQVGQGGDDTVLASNLEAVVGADLINCLCTTAEYRGASVQRVSPGSRTLATIATGTAGPGAVAGDPLPPQTAGLVALRTEFAGASARGRIFVPFPSEASNSADGVPENAYVTSLQLLGAELLNTNVVLGPGGPGVDESTMVPVLWKPGQAVPLTLVQSSARRFWASQRRRSFATSGDAFPF